MEFRPAVALYTIITLAASGMSAAVFAQAPTPNTQDYCVFNNSLYSFDAIVCLGKNRALRCDGPAKDGNPRTSHWTLMDPESTGTATTVKLGDACSLAGPSAAQ
jgi:hypothetical protein